MISLGELKNRVWITGPQDIPTSRNDYESIAAPPGERSITLVPYPAKA